MVFFDSLVVSESVKFIVSTVFQLLITIGAWLVAYSIHKGSTSKQNEELRLKLYDRRYTVYLSFKEFIEECVIQDLPGNKAITKFDLKTDRLDFLFGKEVLGYKKEVIANAIAIIGISKSFPCVMPPVVGSMLGYFPGSSKFTNVEDLREWFHFQMDTNLEKYFDPYLNFSKAGVNLDDICMKPAELPDPPLVRRRIKK